MSLLSIESLSLQFHTSEGAINVLRNISLSVQEGEALGIVGESGSGKSVTSLAILGLLANNAQVMNGKILFRGQNLLSMHESELEKIRGQKISMIFQDPLSSLDPCYTVEEQIREILKAHQKPSDQDTVLQLLKSVGIPHPEMRVKSYPHELSGGMCQRIMIAIAIACNPDLLIADEPTTALDVTVQAQILALIGKLRREKKMGLILVSHDLGMISQHTDRIIVMYAGEVVEEGVSRELLSNPKHPYTKALLKSSPSLAHSGQRLATIPGVVPDLRQRQQGCQFSPRCSYSQDVCTNKDIPWNSDWKSRCLFN